MPGYGVNGVAATVSCADLGVGVTLFTFFAMGVSEQRTNLIIFRVYGTGNFSLKTSKITKKKNGQNGVFFDAKVFLIILIYNVI
jgi:hypothetical protein